MVAARQLGTGQVQLAGHADGDRVQARIQHEDLGIPLRLADRDGEGVGAVRLAEGDRDRGLGGTVEIVHPGVADRPEGGDGLGRQRLADDEDITQRIEFARLGVRGEDREHGGHEVGERDPVPGNGFGDVAGIAVAVGGGDHQGRARAQRQEVAPQRDVEGGGGLLEVDVLAAHAVFGLHPGQLVGDGAVGDRDALGLAGGAGGEKTVGRMVGVQDGAAFPVGDLRAAVVRQVDLIEVMQWDVDGFGQGESIPPGGQHRVRARGGEDVADALGRMARIHRHVRAARAQHRVHGRHQLHRARHGQHHQRFRAHPGGDQVAGHAVGALGELGVGEFGVAEDQGAGVRGAGRLGVETLVQEQVRDAGAGGVPARGDVVAFTGVEEFDIADRDRGVGGRGGEQAGELGGELAHRVFVEKVGGVVELDPVAVAVGDDGQLQVELGDAGIEVQFLGAEAGQGGAELTQVLHEQGHLEQRVAVAGAGRIEHLDQALEGDVAVGEGAQIPVAHMGDELAEGVRAPDLGAQHQGVDEHADQGVEGLVAASGDGRADGDVGGARQPGQHRGERGVQHHERGGAVGGGDPVDGGAQLGVDLGLERRAPEAGGRRARVVRGQVELRGQIVEFACPERDLAGRHRFRIGFVAHPGVLPQRVVGVLHRERLVLRALAGLPREVGHDQIPHQRSDGRAVGGDVVGDHHQGVVGGAGTQQPSAQRHLGGDVESLCGQGEYGARQLVLGHLARGQVDRGGGQHHLGRALLGARIVGAQRLVALDDIGEGGRQRRGVQLAAQAQRERHIVHGRRVEFVRGRVVFAARVVVEEPHALLGG
ncbi:hypothetical protein NS07_v2contig00080-0003 [Nocardia seriolae]|nr:hypothetical protein NS07_v2contig00080-0003 [Nocardia seriolae]